MQKLKTIISEIVVVILLFSCGNNMGTGTQTWAKNNLGITRFRNGDEIIQVKTDEEWQRFGEQGKPAWCYYQNEPVNGEKYGKLYNWFAVHDKRGLAPEGWHIPSDEELDKLSNYLGGNNVAGTKLKSTSGWENYNGKDGNGTNTSQFSGLPGGFRYDNGAFFAIGTSAYWWSSTEHCFTSSFDSSQICYAKYCGLSSPGSLFTRSSNPKEYGFYVRCLRN